MLLCLEKCAHGYPNKINYLIKLIPLNIFDTLLAYKYIFSLFYVWEWDQNVWIVMWTVEGPNLENLF